MEKNSKTKKVIVNEELIQKLSEYEKKAYGYDISETEDVESIMTQINHSRMWRSAVAF